MAHPLIKQILLILIRFLSPDMTAEEMLADLGPVIDSSHPQWTITRPGRWQADLVTLTYLDLGYTPHFLSSVAFDFSKAQVMAMADLKQAFGTPKQLPGLRPTAPNNYLFRLDGYELHGSVIVTAVPGANERSLKVQRVTLNRNPPEIPPAEHARALKIVVFTPLAATAVGEGTGSFWTIWEHSSIYELVAHLMPAIPLRLPDHLGFDRKTLEFTFRPASLDDFEPYRILWLFPETALLLNLRTALVELHVGEMALSDLHERMEEATLPEWARQALKGLGPDEAQVSALITALDRVLSAQLAAILADKTMRALRASWLGLAWLAENLEVSNGSRIQVYPVTEENLPSVFRNAFLADEVRHPQGVAPAIVIIDGFLNENLSGLGITEQLLEEAARQGFPIVIGGSLGISPASESVENLAKQAGASNLVIAEPRVLLRLGPEFAGFEPVLFTYKSGEAAGIDTSVWVNGAWLLGAAVAAGHAESQLPGDLGPVPLPERLEPHAHILPDLLEKRSPSPFSDLTTLFEYDAKTRRFIAKRIRTLKAGPGGDISLARRMRSALVLGTFRRVRYRLPKLTPHEEVKVQLMRAIEQCLPGSAVEVVTEASETAYSIRVQVTLPGGEMISHDLTWK